MVGTGKPTTSRDSARNQADAFRTAALARGYGLVAVYSGKKNPVGDGWQRGHDAQRLIRARAGETNTGILTAGLRAVDIDVDRPDIAQAVRLKADQELGPTITRGRPGSSRVLLTYRAADGNPTKRFAIGADHDPKGLSSKVEILGAGQQFVGHGMHEEGTDYTWEGDQGRIPQRSGHCR